MSYVMQMDQNITDVSGYSAFGEVIPGDGGCPWGDPDILTGSDPWDCSYGYLQWGGDTVNGGLDTGSMVFQLDANLATGVDVLTVDGTSISYNGGAAGTVGSVEVRVGAYVAAQVSLDYIGVDFYRAGVLQETDSIPGLSVDTTGPDSPPGTENVLIVTPASSNNDEVVIAGTLKMSAPLGTYASGNDIFCQAFIKPAATQ
jgi:hypothetical protein